MLELSDGDMKELELPLRVRKDHLAKISPTTSVSFLFEGRKFSLSNIQKNLTIKDLAKRALQEIGKSEEQAEFYCRGNDENELGDKVDDKWTVYHSSFLGLHKLPFVLVLKKAESVPKQMHVDTFKAGTAVIGTGNTVQVARAKTAELKCCLVVEMKEEILVIEKHKYPIHVLEMGSHQYVVVLFCDYCFWTILVFSRLL